MFFSTIFQRGCMIFYHFLEWLRDFQSFSGKDAGPLFSQSQNTCCFTFWYDFLKAYSLFRRLLAFIL